MAIAAIGFTSCKKDKEETPSGGSSLTVEQKNRGILIDFSETWCPPCGAYGGPAFDSCLSIESSKITLIKVYGSSTPASLNSSVSNGFASAYNVSGVPDFWFNNSEQNAGGGVYSSISSNYNWVNNKATTFAAEPVVAGIALKKEIVAGAHVEALGSAADERTHALDVRAPAPLGPTMRVRDGHAPAGALSTHFTNCCHDTPSFDRSDLVVAIGNG